MLRVNEYTYNTNDIILKLLSENNPVDLTTKRKIAMIRIQPKMQIFSQAQMEEIFDKALWVLKNVGVKVICPDMRQLFSKQSGVKCDGDVVKLPKELVEQALRTVPSKVNVFNRLGESAFSLGPDFNDKTRFSVGSPQLNYQDPVSRELEEWTRSHTGLIAGLTNSLDAFDAIATPGAVKDYGPQSADYYSTLEMMAKTIKPIILLVANDAEFSGILKFADKMLNGTLRETPCILPYLNIITPLVMGKGTTDKMKIANEYNLPVVFMNYAMIGATAPISSDGHLTLMVAELLMGITSSQLIKKGSQIIAGGMANNFNMSTMTPFYAPKGMLVSHGIAEMMEFFGVPHVGTSGNNLGWEGDVMHQGMTWMNHLPSLMGKTGLCPFAGPIFQATTLSATGIVLASEVIREARKYHDGFDLGEESTLDEIMEIGVGGSYLATQSTFKRFRKLQPDTSVFPYYTSQKWEEAGKPTATQVLREKTQEILDHPKLPDDCEEMLERGEKYIENLGLDQ